MSRDTLLDQIIAGFHEVALNSSHWRPVLADLCQWVGADGFHLLGWNPETDQPLFGIVSDDFQPRAITEYNSHYGAMDPRLQILNRQRAGDVLLCQRKFDASFVRRSEFYQDFLKKYGVRYLAGATLSRHRSANVVLALLRSARRGAYSDEQAKRISQLMPYLQRVVTMHERAVAMADHLRVHQLVSDTVAVGILVVDESANLLYANGVAEGLLSKDGPLIRRRGRLAVSETASSDLLMPKLQQAARTRLPQLLSLRRVSQDTVQYLQLTIQAAAPEMILSAWTSKSFVIVVTGDVARFGGAGAKQLAAQFGFTPAETRLAIALASGSRVIDYAKERRLSPATVRTQLRALLDKSQTKRQADFIRRINAIPIFH